MLRILLAVLAATIGVVVAAALAGSAAWHRDTQAAVTRLATNIGPMAFAPSLLNAVPPPVARYFRATLRDGQPMIRSAVATQDAEFFINGAWRPLTATQHFRASPPAFIWDARIQMAPLLPALVRDAYADGQGAMKASMLGVFTLAHRAGLRELNLGALQRFLGEAIWLPTALLPGDAVSWTAKDDHSATATLRDRGLEVSLLFEFDDEDMVRQISGERYKEAQGQFALERWLISCGDPSQRDGIRIPTRCEVAWLENGLPVPYWRGRITTIRYTY